MMALGAFKLTSNYGIRRHLSKTMVMGEAMEGESSKVTYTWFQYRAYRSGGGHRKGNDTRRVPHGLRPPPWRPLRRRRSARPAPRARPGLDQIRRRASQAPTNSQKGMNTRSISTVPRSRPSCRQAGNSGIFLILMPESVTLTNAPCLSRSSTWSSSQSG